MELFNKKFKTLDHGLGPLTPMKERRILNAETLLKDVEINLYQRSEIKLAAKLLRIAIEELEELEAELNKDK
jgi:hypothetical protein